MFLARKCANEDLALLVNSHKVINVEHLGHCAPRGFALKGDPVTAKEVFFFSYDK